MMDQPDSFAARIKPISGLTATGLPTERNIGRSTWLSAYAKDADRSTPWRPE